MSCSRETVKLKEDDFSINLSSMASQNFCNIFTKPNLVDHHDLRLKAISTSNIIFYKQFHVAFEFSAGCRASVY